MVGIKSNTNISASSLSPAAMQNGEAMEMMPRRGNQASHELEADTDYQPVNWKRLFLAPKYLVCWIVAIIVLVLTVIITIRHDEVVAHLRPWSEKVRDLPAGWLIPIAILIVISFPPLFGHELVALLCGVVYGLWIGFGIVAAGTFLGELGTWFAFKYLLRRKALKLERTNLSYGALARLTRDGGFWIILLIRLSALPTHFSTAVFSTCGVRFLPFALATLLTLPKQIFLVYLGVLLLQDPPPDHSTKNVVFAVAFGVTLAMAGYLWWKMRGVKRVLVEEQAERRRKVLLGGGVLPVRGGVDGGGDDDEDGRRWVGSGTTQMRPSREGEYEVVGQDVDTGGVVRTVSGAPTTRLHPGPQYRPEYGYQGAASTDSMHREPVREQAWV